MKKITLTDLVSKELFEDSKPRSGWQPIQVDGEQNQFPKVEKKYTTKSLFEFVGGNSYKKQDDTLINTQKVEEKKQTLIVPIVEFPTTHSTIATQDAISLKSQDQPNLVQVSVEQITKDIFKEESFQQPDPSIVGPDINDIRKKLKFLEQAMGKMFAHGPGGGDANPFDRVEFMERGVRFTPTPRMMYWNNTEDCVNITQADGSTLQVGLENYIRVYNNTANTFANGTFVEFTGVGADGKSPTFRAFENNSNAQPLYSIGVLTTDVQSNTHGRATCLGLVRDIDTTGNAVGETWSIGDILWANPSYPGKFTKVKPTSPNVAISVAAVTTVGETDGMILVRPAIWPRLRYGDFFSTTTQTAPTSNTDVRLAISNTLISSGFTLTGNTMVALDSGLYKFQSRVQIVSSSSSTKSIVLWYKKNAVNVERSAVRQSISENGGFRTITNTQIISLDAGDNVSVHFAVTDTSLSVAAPDTLDGAPQIPSIQIAISEIAL